MRMAPQVTLQCPLSETGRCRCQVHSRRCIGARTGLAFFAPLVSALPLIKDGKVQALAVSTPARSAVLPDLPTTVEAGTPGSEYLFWVGLLVAAKTPREIVRRLNEEVLKALASSDVKVRLTSLGAEPMPMTPEAFDAFIRSEVEQGRRIAKAANLKPQ